MAHCNVRHAASKPIISDMFSSQGYIEASGGDASRPHVIIEISDINK
jgi:hypothetical protein